MHACVLCRVRRADNWDVNATVTVRGVPDDVVDGDIAYHVAFLPRATGAGGGGGGGGVARDAALGATDAFSGVAGARLALINRDTAKERVGVALGFEARSLP